MTILVLHTVGENIEKYLTLPGEYACYPLRPSTKQSIQGMYFDRAIFTAEANRVLNVNDLEVYQTQEWANEIRATVQRGCSASLGSVTVEN